MKHVFLIISLLLLLSGLSAGWSNDPSSPTLIAGGTGSQALPKVAVGADGNTYISYFENTNEGYRVMLTLLNTDGEFLWDPSTVELAGSVSQTWLTDYDLTADQSGNALLTFQDIRSGINSVYIYKVSASGQQLWGDTGLGLSTNSPADDPDYTPVVLNTQDNSTYVAWAHTGSLNQIMLQKISEMGQTQWASPLIISADEASCSWPQLLETDDNCLLMKYYVDSGPYWAPIRHIKVARINPSGTILWDQDISTAGGITAWTQIIGFAPDGEGGAALTWHDDRDMDSINQAFFAHISATGEVTTPANGAYVSSDGSIHQFYPQVACDSVTEEARVVMRVTDVDQNLVGVVMQIFDYAGNRLMGSTGQELESLSSFDRIPHFAWNYGGIFYYFYEKTDSIDPMAQNLFAARNADLGFYNNWMQDPLASTPSQKLHHDFASHPGGWVINTWEDDAGDADIYAMKYYYNGNVGDFNGAPQNLTAEFIPPSSIQVTWDHPQYTQALGYHLHLNDQMVELPPTETDCTFTDLPLGNYSIWMRAVYEDGELSDPTDTVEITVVSNQDLVAAAMKLKVAPNPFNGQSLVTWQNKQAGPCSLSLYNLRGQKVYKVEIPSARGEQSHQLQPGKLPAGIYFLSLKNVTGTSRQKVVILP